MEDVVSQAKAELIRTKERMVRTFEATPTDRQNWSPAPTARTPVQLVGHSALAIQGIQDMLQGKPFPFATTAEADAAFRAADQEFTNSEQALDLLEKKSVEFLKWLDMVTPEQLATSFESPFGPIPMVVGITLPALHMQGHVAQVDYIQTICGDRIWH